LAVGQIELTWVQNGPVGFEKIYGHALHIDVSLNEGGPIIEGLSKRFER